MVGKDGGKRGTVMSKLRLWKFEQGDFYRASEVDAAMAALKLTQLEDSTKIVAQAERLAHQDGELETADRMVNEGYAKIDELKAQLDALTTDQPDQIVEQAARRAWGIWQDSEFPSDFEELIPAQKELWVKAILAAQLSDHWRAESMRKQRRIGMQNDEIKRLKRELGTR
jgi:uncharacterized coiled-coil protein SlyX